MLSGKPIIGYIDGISADIIRDAKCGYVEKPNNYIGLANRIIKMSKLPKKKLNTMGYNGKFYCINNYNLNKITRKLQYFMSNV